MATKTENIITLQQLAEKLGRPVDITGSAAVIEQRVAEWQEEANSLGAETNGETGAATTGGEGAGITDSTIIDTENTSDGADGESLVLVDMVKTTHIPGAYDATGKKKLSVCLRGTRVHVPEKYLAALSKGKVIA